MRGETKIENKNVALATVAKWSFRVISLEFNDTSDFRA